MVPLAGNGKSRKRIDPEVLQAKMKEHDRRARRREQFRQASARKRQRKREARAITTRMPRTVLEHLSSGDFPALRPIEAMGKLGLTNAEIADVLGVTKGTFQRWVTMSPRLRASLHRGRKIADTHVADSLYMQALGFSVPEEKIFYDTKRGSVVRVEGEKYYPPNAVAAIFWLKNRYAEFWRDHKADEQGPAGGSTSIGQVKFVLVQAPQGNSQRKSEKVLDGDYRILGNEEAGGES